MDELGSVAFTNKLRGNCLGFGERVNSSLDHNKGN